MIEASRNVSRVESQVGHGSHQGSREVGVDLACEIFQSGVSEGAETTLR
jgi:hypothetical protein